MRDDIKEKIKDLDKEALHRLRVNENLKKYGMWWDGKLLPLDKMDVR